MISIDLSTIKIARYIKLGVSGCWNDLSFSGGTIRLGYDEVPHEMGLSGDKEGIRQIYEKQGKKAGSPSNHARQVLEFYSAGSETLWITFAYGYLWWAVADQDVAFISNDPEQCHNGSRFKRTLTGWNNASIIGEPLLIGKLSGKLTCTARYSGTICKIKSDAFEYLLLKLHGQELPLVQEAKVLRQQMLHVVEALVQRLCWSDFELFVNLIFERCGWRRVSDVGGDQETVDIVLVRGLPEQRALVQIKSVTDQQTLSNYIANLSKMAADQIFYVYHTTKSELNLSGSAIKLIGPAELAQYAFNVGLVDWLMDKVG